MTKKQLQRKLDLADADALAAQRERDQARNDYLIGKRIADSYHDGWLAAERRVVAERKKLAEAQDTASAYGAAALRNRIAYEEVDAILTASLDACDSYAVALDSIVAACNGVASSNMVFGPTLMKDLATSRYDRIIRIRNLAKEALNA